MHIHLRAGSVPLLRSTFGALGSAILSVSLQRSTLDALVSDILSVFVLANPQFATAKWFRNACYF